MVNKKRVFHQPEELLEEDDRNRVMTKIFTKVRDIEDDRLTNQSSTQSSFNKTSGSNGFMGSTNPN